MGLSGKSAVVSKNRVGKNLFGRAKSHLKTATQPAESQQENRATNEKIASGAPHYRARYYSPQIGRFISRDPLANAECLQGPNLYWYIGNKGPNRMDPLGLKDVPPEGTYILRDVPKIPVNDLQALESDAPEFLDGYEIEYQPADSCPCKKEEIRLVQVIEGVPGFFTGLVSTGPIKPHVDVTDKSFDNANKNTPGGTPPPGYVQAGGHKGNHGALSYIDAPYGHGSIQWNMETCVLCNNGTNLGCVTFSFSNTVRNIVPSSGTSIAATKPGTLWATGMGSWVAASGKKP